MTIVHLPFFYEAAYSRKRDKDSTRHWVFDVHPFDIADIDVADTKPILSAPIAGIMLTFREHGGKLYRPIVKDEAILPSLDQVMPLAYPLGPRAYHESDHWPDDPSRLDIRFRFDLIKRYGARAASKSWVENPTDGAQPFREWGYVNREKRLEEAMDRYADLALIDGVPHMVSSEPCYRLTQDHVTRALSVEVVAPPLAPRNGENVVVHFRLDEIDALRRAISMLVENPSVIDGRMESKTAPAVVDIPEVVLHEPFRPSNDPDRWTLIDIASYAATMIADKTIQDLDPTALVAFATLFDMCRKERFSEQEMDRSRAAVAALVDRGDDFRRRRETSSARMLAVQAAARDDAPLVVDDMDAIATIKI